jgi:hypothetical protein
VSETDEAVDSKPKTWTSRYRLAIAIGSGVLALLCFWLLFNGGAAGKWIGGIGLAALVVWVFVFSTLYRRGY